MGLLPLWHTPAVSRIAGIPSRPNLDWCRFWVFRLLVRVWWGAVREQLGEFLGGGVAGL